MVNSLISVYYYLMVIRQMYIKPAPEGSKSLTMPKITGAALLTLVGVVFLIGIYPQSITGLIEKATPALFG